MKNFRELTELTGALLFFAANMNKNQVAGHACNTGAADGRTDCQPLGRIAQLHRMLTGLDGGRQQGFTQLKGFRFFAVNVYAPPGVICFPDTAVRTGHIT